LVNRLVSGRDSVLGRLAGQCSKCRENMVTTPLLFCLARKLAGASLVAGGRPSPSVAQGADGDALFAQGGDLRLACKDMFGITLKAQPPVRQATAVFAGPYP